MKPSATPTCPRRFSDPDAVLHAPSGAGSAALAGLSLSMLMSSLATSIANASLPALARNFATSFQAAQWIMLAYLLTITVTVAVAGKLGDLFGRRRLLLSGIFVFAFASLLCGIAPSLPILIAARGLQGLGAAVMMALTMAFVGDVVPKERTGQAMGSLGTMSAIGTTLGPSLGGIMIAFAGWPSIFLINIPLAVLSFVLAWRTLPADAPRNTAARGGFDFAGTALLFVTLGAYALAMTIGREHFGQINTGLITLAIGAGVAFLVVETKAASPLIRLGLFKTPAFATGIATSVLISTVMMATLVVGPFYLSGALHLDPAMLGIILSAGPLVAALTGVPAGRFVDRFGPDRVIIAGLTLVMTGTGALPLIPLGFGVVGYVVPIIAMTSGYAVFQAANNSEMMMNAMPNQRGVMSGMLNLSRNLGLVTGASVMGAIFAYGVGADVVTAQPEALAVGVRTAFAVAFVFVAIALGMTVRRRAAKT